MRRCMSSRNQAMARTTHSIRGLLTLAVVALLATGLSLHLAQASADANRPNEPMTLRYGILDPPVVLEHDITIRAKTSIHPLDPAPKPLECSSVCWAQGRLFLTSDRHEHVLFSMPLELDGQTLEPGLPEPMQVVATERLLLDDAEALTSRYRRGRTRLYVMCSMSNDPDGTRRSKRQHFARIELSDTGELVARTLAVIDNGTVRDALQAHFEALHVTPYASFDTGQSRNTPRWANVEGIAWAPAGDTLLCGMRNPLAGEDAMLFTLQGVDQAFDDADPSKLRVTDLFRLNLGGRGVTDLAWDANTNGYLITAALSNGPKLSDDQPYPLEHLDSALFWWSGQKREQPVLVAKMAGLNIDGVCRVGQTPYLALTSDEGDVSEGRQGRQSILLLLAYPLPAASSAVNGEAP